MSERPQDDVASQERAIATLRQIHTDLPEGVIQHAVHQSREEGRPDVAVWVRDYRARLACYTNQFPSESARFLTEYLAVCCHTEGEALHMLALKRRLIGMVLNTKPDTTLLYADIDKIVGSYIARYALQTYERRGF